MAREKRDPFAKHLEAMGGKPTDKTQTADTTPTERLQSADSKPMKDYRVRLPESWWQELKRRAAARGLKPSQLLREIVAEWLSQ